MTAVAIPSTPRRAGALRKYVACARLAWSQAASERASVIGRTGFYTVILLVFTQLWGAVDRGGLLGEIGPVELIWYLAVTEWIALGVPPFFLEIEAEIRNGDIAYRLPRPISYLGSQLAHTLGDVALRMSVLAVFGCALAFALTGSLPASRFGLACTLPLAAGAALLVIQVHTMIGLGAFWLQDCSPFYWIYQKALFVFGGLMLPLEIYPEWLRGIAVWTPFAAMLHAPARSVFAGAPAELWEAGLRIALWNGMAAGLLWVIYRRALRVLDVNGG